MNNRQKLIINSSSGGNGDIWMRLVSFYAMAGILKEYEIQLLIPAFFKQLAQFTFGDRLTFIGQEDIGTVQLDYTNLGLKDLMGKIIKGKRFISPYQRSVIRDKKTRQLKDQINIFLFSALDLFGLVQIPDWKWVNVYQGYLDIIGIKKLRPVSYQQYLMQLESDSPAIYLRLNSHIPTSAELAYPDDLKDNLLAYPTGTSRQFIPVWWAVKHLPDAYYAFFHKDADAALFKAAGLKTVFFYKEPGDIIALSKEAKWTVTTDSFPSHLLQYASKKCSITITEVLRSRIISPVFKGNVIDAQVKCHPCLHLDRKNHPLCAAGFTECQNWINPIYTNDLLQSVDSVNQLSLI